MTNPTAATLHGNATPAQLLYPDLDQEFASTRKMLACVPDGNNDWKPHDKSFTLDRLATHVAELPGFATFILMSSELDWATFKYEAKSAPTTAQRLVLFDDQSAQMKAAIEGADWAAVSEFWTMRSGDQIMIKAQKATLLRTMGLSHMAHHRAQLGVYLRELGIAIPGMYGPSADEM